MHAVRLRLALLAVLVAPALAGATIYQGNPSNYLSLLSGLQPGDTLQLAAGTYYDQLQIIDMHGNASGWIVITGPQSGSPARFVADNCCNTVQFDNASYIEVSYLTLDGAGTDGPFGVDSRNVTHHITISDLTIINYGADQLDDGISTKGPAWNWIVRHNRIIGAGTGMYFGSSNGDWPFVAGLIEYNLVLDSVGYDLQIKHQNPRPTNIGMPTGVNRTIIRHNVFGKANTPVELVTEAQPNVLVGHLPLSGDGQDDVYEIYGNFFYENPIEALFQGEGNIGLYGNLFVTSTGDAINIQPHNAVPREVTVFQNTVVAAGRGIYVTGGDPGFVQRIVGNAVFASPAIQGPNQSANITGTYAAAPLYLNDPHAPIGQLDLYPLPGTLTGTAIGTTTFTAYTDWDHDFNGTLRDETYRGAYSGAGMNPGWQLALDFKDPPDADGDGDGVPDAEDNCTLAANASQCDSDGDGFGNACDADLNNNDATNAQDYGIFRTRLGNGGSNPYDIADLNCNGTVNAQDYGILRSLLGSPPGPSGVAP